MSDFGQPGYRPDLSTVSSDIAALNHRLQTSPDDFDAWEALVKAAESQDGGVNRNSRPEAVAYLRDTFDRFLARFPLVYLYWEKYARNEYQLSGPEAAEMVYERGIACMPHSAHLWTAYCEFKMTTDLQHQEPTRQLFDRAVEFAGLDFSHGPLLWDKYIEFEERHGNRDNTFAILCRVIAVPTHKFQEYMERYTTMAAGRPIRKRSSPETVKLVLEEMETEGHLKSLGDEEVVEELQSRLQRKQIDLASDVWEEVQKRVKPEQQIGGSYYYHPKLPALDSDALANWKEYLDFEEEQGDYKRTKLLYERFLIPAADHEEIWFRYIRWITGKNWAEMPKHIQDVRNVIDRAVSIHLTAAQPTIRLYYAKLEECVGDPGNAIAIYDQILDRNPGHLQAIVSKAHAIRRQEGLPAAMEQIERNLESADVSHQTKASLVAEMAKLQWTVGHDADAARDVYRSNVPTFRDSQEFWLSWLLFEIEQPTTAETAAAQHACIQNLYQDIRKLSTLSPTAFNDLSTHYFKYLEERNGTETLEEWIELDLALSGVKGAWDGVRRKRDPKEKATVPSSTNGVKRTHEKMVQEDPTSEDVETGEGEADGEPSSSKRQRVDGPPDADPSPTPE